MEQLLYLILRAIYCAIIVLVFTSQSLFLTCNSLKYPDVMAETQHLDNMARLPPAHCTKIFVQRDYADGTGVKFQTKFPQELEGKIDRSTFESTVNELNALYSDAESLSARTYCENCFACLTAYIIFLCMDTHYEKVLKKIGRYIQDQNNNVYIPRGVLLIDPVERGLRVLEICILTDSNQPR